jgi:hypothetical protein
LEILKLTGSGRGLGSSSNIHHEALKDLEGLGFGGVLGESMGS